MPYLEGTNGDITDDGNQSYNHNRSGWGKRLIRSISLNAIYKINSNLNLVGNFGLRDGESHYFNDEDGIGLDLLTGKWTDLGEQQSAELRLESISNKRFSWLAGAYYYQWKKVLMGRFSQNLFFSTSTLVYPCF